MTLQITKETLAQELGLKIDAFELTPLFKDKECIGLNVNIQPKNNIESSPMESAISGEWRAGDQALVTEVTFRNGWNGDRLKAEQYLTVGRIYTVRRVVIMNWETEIYLDEFPKVKFNSVQFSKIIA